ncbi:rod shape-determining protein MreC [Enterobacteriaceae endosymbiont of Macroplea mutica]|uniref:rod shape-determining protein MreC n=1 Tax=Enterobacteriaceae endosymbiont of Macroplea mutica TaxID=2675791 RepID=UPI001449082A|nr:rod shape-determining protein MreC [Enterobacteriaceae endosymbiont of Macroplea mutica]QJC31059.1 rod shape-determining protein MreC [Enterobacteriaceae endosymbiont of Macroplea mutica]
MPLIFKKKTNIHLKFIIIIIISILFIIIDKYYNYFFTIKNYIDKKMSYTYVYLNKPYTIYNHIYDLYKQNKNIKAQNILLYKKLFLKNIELFFYKNSLYEFNNIYKILSINLNTTKTIFSKKIPIILPWYSDKIFINKGLRDNIIPGNLAINDHGVIGQVFFTNKYVSSILLICSRYNSIHVHAHNNNANFILNGIGCKYPPLLKSEDISPNIIINVNDILFTSGLNDYHLINYPVAKVINIKHTKNNMNVIFAQPLIQIEQIKYLLIINT